MTTELLPQSISAATPLTVLDLGLVTSLATGWKETCAAMRAGYDAFVQPENCIYSMAQVPFDKNIRGFTRLAHLLELAKLDLDQAYEGLPVLCALPEPDRAGLFSFEDTRQKIFAAMAKLPAFQGKFLREHLETFKQGRTAFAHQLARAQEILTTTEHDKVMIMAVDTWLFPQTINSMLAGHWDSDPITEKRRLITSGNGEDHTDGFIPSEAAGFIIVSQPNKHSSPYLIDGVANAIEPVPLLSKEVSKAEGLSLAIKQVCDLAKAPFMDYPLRIGSVSGEQYFFKEASLAQTKNLTKKIPTQPLWLPASHIGEVGCVCGMAMLAMAMDGFKHKSIEGDKVLCHISGDTHDRAAFSVKHISTRVN